MRVIVTSGLHGEQGESQEATIATRTGPGGGLRAAGTRGAGRERGQRGHSGGGRGQRGGNGRVRGATGMR